MKTLRHRLQPFLTVQFVFVFLISIVLLNTNKTEAHLWINQYHHNFFDYLFYILTQSVEFWGCLTIYVLVAIFKNYKYALIGLISYAVSGLITQVLKRNLFDEYKRPTYHIDDLRLIPDSFGFDQHQHFSFPSGHATAAFSLFVFLTLISKNKKWGFVYGVLACLTAFSRVYLSQHYFVDILAGSIIGSLITIIIFYRLNKFSFGKWGKKSILTSFS